MKKFNFTQPFAMRCDAEQFKSVKNELEKMGYNVIESGEGRYLCTNYGNYNFQAGLGGVGTYQPLVIETFNRDLCLALAAMTDKPDGIIGEWFKGCNGVLVQKKDETDLSSIAVKATADELIKYFTEAEIPKLTAEDIEEFRADFSEIQNQGCANLGVIDDHKYFDVINDTQTEQLQKQIAKLAERNTENERQIETLWSHVKGHVKRIRHLESYNSDIIERVTKSEKIACNHADAIATLGEMVKVAKNSPTHSYANELKLTELDYRLSKLEIQFNEPQPEPTKLADKQEVWAWDDDFTSKRIAAFWDAKNECTFDHKGKRYYHKFDHYEPIPADQIPQWMKEAKLKLED